MICGIYLAGRQKKLILPWDDDISMIFVIFAGDYESQASHDDMT